MNTRNIAVLLVIIALSAGFLYYQVIGPTAPARDQAKSAAPEATGAKGQQISTSAPAVESAQGANEQSEPLDGSTPNTPEPWGRNPFAARPIATVPDTVRPPAEIPLTPVVETQAPAAPSPAPEVEPLPAHVFSGVLISGSDSIVFLNGRLMRVGSRIGNETIREIRVDSVILESEGRTRELSRRTNPGTEKNGVEGI